jgi:glycine cleavage system H protein
MSNVPAELEYTEAHEWIRRLPDGTAEVGITDHAQHALGDIVYVELPEVGRAVNAGEACAVVESVKSASDVYSPVSGEVIARNGALETTPEAINQDPYGAGWMMRVRLAPGGGEPKTLSAAAYTELLSRESD